jgi:broad specificity phosphatase PhoE
MCRSAAAIAIACVGLTTGRGAGAWSAANEAAAEPNGDTFLTENGHEQVEAFGSYWAPLLQHAAQRGKLRVFCSPMRRNLQTAAPLLRQLDALGCRVVADVRRDNFEVPGMVHPADSPAMAEIQRLVGG